METKNIDIKIILEGKPQGTRLYSPAFGEVELITTKYSLPTIPILVRSVKEKSRLGSFAPDGSMFPGGECLLFPSKDMHDWTKFHSQPEFKPFDRWCRYDEDLPEYRKRDHRITKALKICKDLRKAMSLTIDRTVSRPRNKWERWMI